MAFTIGEGVVRVTLNSAGVVAKLGAITAAAGAAGAALGALPALAGSVAGIGGVLAGSFAGVGDALKGYQADQKAAMKTGNAAASAAKSNARQIRDAQQSVDDARRNAARVARDASERIQEAQRDEARVARDVAEAIADARERQSEVAEQGAEKMEDAARRVADALEDERDAQEDLTRAREDAARKLEDLRERVSDYALDQEGAAIRVARAEEKLAEVQADPEATALDLRDAIHDLNVARERQSDLAREAAQDAAELAEQERLGIEGSEKVVDAREKVADAEQKVEDTRRDQARTAKEVADANQDAAERVAEAVRDGAEKQADAARAVAQAQRDGAEARADADRQVQDALQSLRDAQDAANESLSSGAAATSQYAEAMAKLLPDQRALVEQLIAMSPLVDRLKAAGSETFLPGLVQMLKDSEGLFPLFETHLRNTGTIMGETARRFGELFKNDEFKKNLQAMLDSSLPITQAIGDGMASFLERFVRFGAEMAPVSEGVAYFITAVIDGFNLLFDTLAPHAETFKQVWVGLGDVFKVLMPVLGELIVSFAMGLAPALQVTADVLQVIAPALPAIIAGFLGLLAAVKVANTLAGVWKMLSLAFTLSPFGLVIALIAGLVAALITAYNTSETFRGIVDAAFKAIGAAGVWLWENALKPAFDAIVVAFKAVGDFFVWAWQNVIRPTWDALGAGIKWVWENIIRPAWDALKVALQAVGDFFRWVWGSIIKPAWDALGVGIRWVIDNIVLPAWNNLRAGLQAVGDFFRWIWNSVIKPAWDALGNGIRWVVDNVLTPVWNGLKRGLQGISDAFTNTVDWVRRKWDEIKEAARKPVQWVIDVVYNNGIRSVWNGIADIFGMSKLNPVHLAGGGVIPGYQPGVDSVPAMLSPGEAVLVPELVRQIGAGNILAANKAASGRPAGSGGRYAGGGIIGGLASFAGDLFTKGPVGAVRDLFSGIVGSLDQMPGGGFIRKALFEIPTKVINAIVKKAQEWVSSLFAGGGGGSGSPAVVSAVRGVAATYGWGSGPQWDALNRIIQKESSWNPAAANPTSSARGLFQKMTSIHGPVEGTPAGQAQWGLSYIRSRYGNPVAALAFHNRNGWYDSGGMLPSGMAGFNGSGRPERVLSPSQTEAFERLVATLERMQNGPQRRSQGDVHVHLEQTSGSPAETGRFVALAMRTVG